MANLSIKISSSAIANNLKTFKKLIGKKTLLAPAIKANAYGHGLIPTSKLMAEYGADWLCITSVEEAAILRRAGIRMPLLIIGPIQLSDTANAIKNDCRVFISSIETATALDNEARRQNKKINTHLKIDSGMGRQGIASKSLADFFQKISRLKNIEIEGIATHFATADEKKNNRHFLNQLKDFRLAATELEELLSRKIIKHCANSAAAMLYPETRMDLCRIGIAAYGCYPSNTVKQLWEKSHQALKPAMSVLTKITQIKMVPANSYVSYGCTYVTQKTTKLATIPVGYFEGLPRSLSNRGYVWIKNKKAPIIGRVCMDITVIDVSDIDDVSVGDEVEIIGNNISAEDLAQAAQTINYEILTNWKESIPRLTSN